MILKRLSILSAVFLLILGIVFWGSVPSGYSGKKVIVLGFDGLDPNRIQKFVDQKKLPNFSRLIEVGSFSTLGTTTPPQSPVAWASFITGNNPGKHNIFDFLVRDPDTYQPKLTITSVTSPTTVSFGSYSIPLGGPKIVSYRQGEPFWKWATDEGIPSTVLLVPVTFPPDEDVTMLSGMGVPDLLGTNGTFSFYTTKQEPEIKTVGGNVIHVKQYYDLVEMELVGPPNELLKEAPSSKIPFTAEVLSKGESLIKIQDRNIRLKNKHWSNWIPVTFKMDIPIYSIEVKGMIRFYLVSAGPDFQLYVSPINLDPAEPMLTISNPPEYSQQLADKMGPFYTQGMPEDTWALNEYRLDDTAFLDLTLDIQKSRVDIFKEELRNLKRGILVSVFVSPDRVQHMFTRYIDSESPLYAEAKGPHKDAIEQVYRYCDDVLGTTMKYLDEQTTLIVLSDHGFSYFRRSVHLNTWLQEEGFLVYKDPSKKKSGEFFENVDFDKTKAYALGLNGIYLNLKGREKNGIVEPGAEADSVRKDISTGLLALKDPKDGKRTFRKVYFAKDIYSGPYAKNAPDLVVGYHHGFRTSWQTAIGGAPESLMEDNKKKWSGDHLIDPALVPGILISNKPLKVKNPHITDLAPTILAEMGIDAADSFDGQTIF